MVRTLDSLDMARQVLVNLVCTISSNNNDFAGNPIWVDDFDQPVLSVENLPSSIRTSSWGSIEGPTLIPLLDQLGTSHELYRLDIHWISNSPEVLDMRSIQLPCPISYPDEVR
jgi:hypothetical protein